MATRKNILRRNKRGGSRSGRKHQTGKRKSGRMVMRGGIFGFTPKYPQLKDLLTMMSVNIPELETNIKAVLPDFSFDNDKPIQLTKDDAKKMVPFILDIFVNKIDNQETKNRIKQLIETIKTTEVTEETKTELKKKLGDIQNMPPTPIITGIKTLGTYLIDKL